LVYDGCMPRKTLALISGLVLVTVILFIIALRTGQQAQQQPANQPPPQQTQPTADVAHTVLTMSPNPLDVAPGTEGTISVDVDTADNPVTAVQLELMYDPTMLTNVVVTPGPLFKGSVVLINKNNPTTGKYTYAFGIQPSQQTVKGTGTVATITFTAKGTVGKQSQITLLPTSLVTARGVATSVLKMGSGTTVVLGSGTASQPQTVTTAPGY